MLFLEKTLLRIKTEKGMSGVLVALFLVIIGVGLVTGVNALLSEKTNDVKGRLNNTYTNVVSDL